MFSKSRTKVFANFSQNKNLTMKSVSRQLKVIINAKSSFHIVCDRCAYSPATRLITIYSIDLLLVAIIYLVHMFTEKKYDNTWNLCAHT